MPTTSEIVLMDMHLDDYTPEMAAECVARGAEFFDQHCQGWEFDTDEKILDLSNPELCMLGQNAHCLTHGAVQSREDDAYNMVLYFTGPGACLDVAIEDDDKSGWARAHGFDVPVPPMGRYYVAPTEWDREKNARYEMLTLCWREEIRRRRAQRKEVTPNDSSASEDKASTTSA